MPLICRTLQLSEQLSEELVKLKLSVILSNAYHAAICLSAGRMALRSLESKHFNFRTSAMRTSNEHLKRIHSEVIARWMARMLGKQNACTATDPARPPAQLARSSSGWSKLTTITERLTSATSWASLFSLRRRFSWMQPHSWWYYPYGDTILGSGATPQCRDSAGDSVGTVCRDYTPSPVNERPFAKFLQALCSVSITQLSAIKSFVSQL